MTPTPPPGWRVIHDEAESLGWPFVMFYNGKYKNGFEQIGMTGSSKVQKNLLRQHALLDLGLDDNKRAPA